jgi:hypothetical protein
MILIENNIRHILLIISLTTLFGLGAMGQVAIKEKISISPAARRTPADGGATHSLKFVASTTQQINVGIHVYQDCISNCAGVLPYDMQISTVEVEIADAMAGPYDISYGINTVDIPIGESTTTTLIVYYDNVPVDSGSFQSLHGEGGQGAEIDSRTFEYTPPFYSHIGITTFIDPVFTDSTTNFNISCSNPCNNCLTGGWNPGTDPITATIIDGADFGFLRFPGQSDGSSVTFMFQNRDSLEFQASATLPDYTDRSVTVVVSSGGRSDTCLFSVHRPMGYCIGVTLEPSILHPGDTASIVIKKLNDDSSIEDFDAYHCFDVWITGAMQSGTLISQWSTGDTLYGVNQMGLAFVAHESISEDSVRVTIGAAESANQPWRVAGPRDSIMADHDLVIMNKLSQYSNSNSQPTGMHFSKRIVKRVRNNTACGNFGELLITERKCDYISHCAQVPALPSIDLTTHPNGFANVNICSDPKTQGEFVPPIFDPDTHLFNKISSECAFSELQVEPCVDDNDKVRCSIGPIHINAILDSCKINKHWIDDVSIQSIHDDEICDALIDLNREKIYASKVRSNAFVLGPLVTAHEQKHLSQYEDLIKILRQDNFDFYFDSQIQINCDKYNSLSEARFACWDKVNMAMNSLLNVVAPQWLKLTGEDDSPERATYEQSVQNLVLNDLQKYITELERRKQNLGLNCSTQ